MRVDLLGIRTVRTPEGMQVQLVFQDGTRTKRVAYYKASKFLAALNLISCAQRERRLEGLSLISIFPGRKQQSHLYFYQFDGAFVGNLGDLGGPSAVNDLLSLLHENGRNAGNLRASISSGQRLTVKNTFLRT